MANRKGLKILNKGSRSNSQPPLPTVINVNTHGTSQSTTTSFDKHALSPNLDANSFQRRSAIHTDYGKSPVSFADDNAIKFDYNVFVTTWQDQIRMRQYENCEKYCREVIDKLLTAADKQQLMDGFGSIIKQTKSAPLVSKKQSAASTKNKASAKTDHNIHDDGGELHGLLEYRSKVHFSLAYLLKKYCKRYDEAKEQYEESIKTDRENPGAHFNLANMLVDHYKDYETAQYHFERSILLEPTYSLYRMTYAEFLWHDIAQYEESAKQYEELIKSDTDNGDIYFNYGLLLRDHLQNIPKALEQFERVMSINPSDSEAHEEYKYTLSVVNNEETKEKQSQEVMDAFDNNSNSNDDHLLNYKQQMLEYQSARKKNNSAFRRSHHEIKLQMKGEDEDMAMDGIMKQKYYQILDEKTKLSVVIQELQQKEKKRNENWREMKQMMAQHHAFRKELELLVRNGANYVEVNAKNAHKVLTLCRNIIAHLDDDHEDAISNGL